GDGHHVNSSFLDGLNNEEAIKKAIAHLEELKAGEAKVTYKLRDWLFSRQRYWGDPIPIIHWEDGTSSAVPEDKLTIELPQIEQLNPSGTNQSTHAINTESYNVT